MAIPLRPEPSPFGNCPSCGRAGEYRNVGSEHWFYCRRHKTKWCPGSNLFSAWRDENAATWALNDAFLASYKDVAHAGISALTATGNQSVDVSSAHAPPGRKG